MSLQGVATTLFLPPLLFCIVGLVAAIVATRASSGRTRGLAGLLATLSFLALLLLATPFVSGYLSWTLSRGTLPILVDPSDRSDGISPSAIIVLSAETARSATAPEVGPLTLERLRAGAALSRRTGLPLLVTGGATEPGLSPLAVLMAETLALDFGMAPRWLEPAAGDTRQNAMFSSRMLRADDIGSAYVVTHAWHMPRALKAFAREGFQAHPWPVRTTRRPTGQLSDWVPRADHLATSWFAIREWAGRIVYALRDGEGSLGRQ